MELMMQIRRARWRGANVVVAGILLSVMIAGCAKKPPPVARPTPPPETPAAPPPAPPPVASTTPPPTPPAPRPPAPPVPVAEATIVPPEPVREDDITSASLASVSLDELNRNSPLKPVFFGYDSAEISSEGQEILKENAALLEKFPTWALTIEGHCDERGTAEYNLALGERRAAAARTYLMSLGVSADRLKTVSYGKEFPFDPGHDESAFSNNRRAHFVITAK
jgi:peptidoglycan-associated lipoprotein